jgi:hypothetical protein
MKQQDINTHPMATKSDSRFWLFVVFTAAAFSWASTCCSAAVRLLDDGGQIVLENETIRVAIEKKTARVVSLQKDGRELMDKGGQAYHQRIAYDPGDLPRHAHDAFTVPNHCVSRTVRQTPDLVEVSFVESDPAYFPFRFDSRFVLRAGESGFYNYVILEYRPEEVPRACLHQLNLAVRLDPEIFVVEQVEADRWRIMPTAKDLKEGKTVMDATVRLPETSRYRQRYGRETYTKYNLMVSHENHRLHGTCSLNEGYGVWFVQPSAEYLNGAPMTQELTVHQTTTTPIILGTYHDTHFGSKRIFFRDSEGPWRKIYGPQFIYVNRGKGRVAMWADAAQTAARHHERWPYSWMSEPDYEISRATVKGRLKLADGGSSAGALLVLAKPESEAGVHWQEQGKDEVFWARADHAGRFLIENVKRGRYTLYASVDGVIGEYRLDGVTSPPETVTELGELEWRPKSYGHTAWQIGIPDRDSTEFRGGDDFRHWGGFTRERFVRDFPESVDFDVGSDDWRRDWNYAHMHVNEKLDTWKIRFTLDELPEGTAHLRFAIAGSRYAGLAVRLAGRRLGQVDLSRGRRYAGQGYPRSGSRGYAHEVVMPFDCALLQAGENVLELTLTPIPGRKDPYRCIHYDCIRLEWPGEDTITSLPSGRELLAKLDLSFPGLEAVSEALEADNLDGAKSALADYYRQRSETYHFVDPRNAAASIRKASSLRRAARALVERTGTWDVGLWQGDRFDWPRAEIRFKERMYGVASLAPYAAAQDGEELETALAHLLRSFAYHYYRDGAWKRGERREGPMWLTMNTGIRLRGAWPVSFLCLLPSTALTDDDVLMMLAMIWDQADYLRRHHSETSNWLTFELAGLYTAGVLCPEFRDAADWRRHALRTAAADLDRGWLPDGLTIEKTPAYGSLFTNYLHIHDLAHHTGRAGEEGVVELLRKTEPLFAAYLKIMTPDRKAPSINDNGIADVARILANGLERFPEREGFRWIVTDGAEGQPPAFNSICLPYAGVAALRSGWERDANLLVFDFGPVGYRHAHQDGLNVALWAYGRRILFDSGTGGYAPGNDREEALLHYSRDTFSHNTVLIDGRPQRRPWYQFPSPKRMPYQEVEDHRWRSDETSDFGAGVYTGPYGKPGPGSAYPYGKGSDFKKGWGRPAVHHRRVLFLKPDLFVVADTLIPDDEEAHDYDLRWHLDSTKTVLDNNCGILRTADPRLPNLEIVPLLESHDLKVRATSAREPPEILGWDAFDPTAPKPATTVQHLKTGRGTVSFFTLLLPLRSSQQSLIEQCTASNDNTWEVTLTDGRTVHLYIPADVSQDLTGKVSKGKPTQDH